MTRNNVLLALAASAATALILIASPAIGQLGKDDPPAAPSGEVQLAQASPDQLAPQYQVDRVVPQSQAQIQQSFAPIVKSTAPAVVNVYSSKVVRQSACPYRDPFWASFYCGGNVGTSERRMQSSLGSGVIIRDDGVIVTNNHVIEGGDEFKVALSDRREFPATLVLADARSDLAVLKIDTDGEKLPTLSYADTNQAEVGDIVLAIGNPFGVGQTVTSGIISALARTDVGVSDFASFIQTDASINPGNSGGALVDMQGDLVGVNSMIFSKDGGSNGIGFAIPSEMVKRVVDAAMNGGTLIRPWIGAKGDTVTSDAAKALGLDRPRGVIVSDLYQGGPADKAGLKKGDVILAVDGREVFDEKGLKFIAATKAEGETVRLSILRGADQREVPVRLARLPGTTDAELKQVSGRNPFSGAVLLELSPALAEEMGLDPFQFEKGMYVYRVPRGTYASRLGLRAGDIVREVNGAQIKSETDLEKAIEKNANASGVWRLAIERNGQRMETQVRI
ncbi:MAG: Do family serine endopeptidase [Hyphomonadaceae bacterium]